MSVDRAKVAEIIDTMRAPLVEDGGDLSLVDISDDGVVTVELHGSCASCPMSSYDISMVIERIIKDRVPGVTRVLALDD